MRGIKKNDIVKVIAGKDKGKTGKVLRVLPAENRVVVEQVNMKKKHQKPTQANPTGGILDIEAPLHVSNVMLLDGKTNQPTRFRTQVSEDGEKVRISVKSGNAID